jgi:hypothetical protein
MSAERPEPTITLTVTKLSALLTPRGERPSQRCAHRSPMLVFDRVEKHQARFHHRQRIPPEVGAAERQRASGALLRQAAHDAAASWLSTRAYDYGGALVSSFDDARRWKAPEQGRQQSER